MNRRQGNYKAVVGDVVTTHYNGLFYFDDLLALVQNDTGHVSSGLKYNITPKPILTDQCPHESSV
jgi:hypothetical protein